MIDPAQALAFSMQANPGVYAVLLGSGVSRAAQIPTSWEIMLDLIRKMAALEKETPMPDPEKWYVEKYKKQADYSDLLEAIAQTPAERLKLLRSYIEPDPQMHDKSARQPTSAHSAIAHLAAQGFVRLIITTNFDRLMETALADAGVQPTIISSPDQMQGALPLIHTQCYLFKIHGDYLDTRIRNTPEELKKYPEEFKQFLERVLDEFGLVICGWSAKWDKALCKAILRTRSRRFTMYWALRGEPGKEAKRLIEHSKAEKILIEDANRFFSNLWEHIRSLKEYSRPHPLSAKLAAASLKRHLEENNLIQLTDLIDETATQIFEIIYDKNFTLPYNEEPNTELATAHVRNYENACSTLLTMAPIGGYWAEEDHTRIWQKSLQRLSQAKVNGSYQFWINLQRYPGTLLLYALGMGAIEADRLPFLGRILETGIAHKDQESILAVQALPPFCLFESDGRAAGILEGMERHRVPLSDWLHNSLKQYIKPTIHDDERYTLIFDKLEILMALGYAYRTHQIEGRYWAPPGAFGWRYQKLENPIFTEIEESLSKHRDASPFVKCDIFGDTSVSCSQALNDLKKFILRRQKIFI